MEVKKTMKKIVILTVAILLTASVAFAITRKAATCSYFDVQNQISAAVDGDIIEIPAGVCNWEANTVTWTDKNISIKGAGIDTTTIFMSSGSAFYVTDENKASFRISGMTIKGSPNPAWGYILISSRYQTVASAVYGWRIDNVKFEQSKGGAITILGVNWGLIDHCEFQNSASGGVEIMHIEIDTSFYNADKPYKYGSGYDWSLPIDWGTEKAVYIEDNIFNAPYAEGAGHPFDTASGGRVVFRYNTVTGGGPLMHPPKNNSIGVIKYEIYGNSLNAGSYTGFYPFTVQGGGTGVVYNNQWNGWSAPWNALNLQERRVSTTESGSTLYSCDGTQGHDGNIERGGWPCFAQVGRGPGGGSEPVYAWNNGVEAGCTKEGGICTDTVKLIATGNKIESYIKNTPHSNGEVDFVNNGNTPKLNYVPYVYPHPLTKVTSIEIGAPVNVRYITD